MGLGVCPCKGCNTESGRSTTCHSSCKRYLKWKNELEDINVAKRKHINEEIIMIGYATKKKDRKRKKHGK